MADSRDATPRRPRRHVAALETLMPHLAIERHHIYRDVTALALLAALIAAGFGSLGVALALTAIALPAAVLVYVHDHRLWRDEPMTLIALAFALSLLLGIAVGLLETQFLTLLTTGAAGYQVPPVDRILQVGLLVPAAAFVAVLIAPLVISMRPAFGHPMDVVVACSLGGAALSLGLGVVVQHGAFTHIQATAGDPAHVAFIAMTLGLFQPIILATAAVLGVLGVRRLGVSSLAGVLEGLLLVVAYELATTLLQPWGTRGIVLTALTAFVLAGAGLAAARRALYAAIAADTSTDAVAPEAAEHRLPARLIAAAVAVVVVIAAAASIAVVNGGPSTRPLPPGDNGDRVVPHSAAPAGSVLYPVDQPGQKRWGSITLTSKTVLLALGNLTTINLSGPVSITLAPGWTVSHQDRQDLNAYNPDRTAGVFASAGSPNTGDISQESAQVIREHIQGSGLTNVQQVPAAPQSVQGQTFNQVLEVDYTCDVQTAQGTMQLWGAWITFYSRQNNMSAFLAYYANSHEQFKASLPDAARMMTSME